MLPFVFTFWRCLFAGGFPGVCRLLGSRITICDNRGLAVARFVIMLFQNSFHFIWPLLIREVFRLFVGTLFLTLFVRSSHCWVAGARALLSRFLRYHYSDLLSEASSFSCQFQFDKILMTIVSWPVYPHWIPHLSRAGAAVLRVERSARFDTQYARSVAFLHFWRWLGRTPVSCAPPHHLSNDSIVLCVRLFSVLFHVTIDSSLFGPKRSSCFVFCDTCVQGAMGRLCSSRTYGEPQVTPYSRATCSQYHVFMDFSTPFQWCLIS